jgi:hypothetical protein
LVPDKAGYLFDDSRRKPISYRRENDPNIVEVGSPVFPAVGKSAGETALPLVIEREEGFEQALGFLAEFLEGKGVGVFLRGRGVGVLLRRGGMGVALVVLTELPE